MLMHLNALAVCSCDHFLLRFLPQTCDCHRRQFGQIMSSEPRNGCCSKLQTFVIGRLRANYMCVLDLNTVRAKDFVMGIWGCLVLGVQIWDYFKNSREAYWLSISMNAAMCVDLLFRLIDQRFSLVAGLTNFAQAKLYKPEPSPWPPSANIARMAWFIFECGLSIGLKATLPSSDWRLMIPNAFFTFWLLVEAAVHWCPFYVVYTVLVKVGYVPVDPGLADRDCFQGSFMGPTCEVNRLRVIKKSAEVQPISMQVQPLASPKQTTGHEVDNTVVEVIDSCHPPPENTIESR